MSSKHLNVPEKRGKILIVGGYGQVGYMIAERLAPEFPGRIVLAGRNLDKAKIAAGTVGHNAEGRAVDIIAMDVGDVLDDIELVLVCLDQTKIGFVEQCLSRGIHYVDISAEHDFQSQVEALDDLAKRNDARALLSVGTAPGLTNLLSARARDQMVRLDRIDILLHFGLGDVHGQAAVEWMFNNIDTTYNVQDNGRARQVRSFGDSIALGLPDGKQERSAYRFNFSDQHVIGRTLDVPSVSTWVQFDDRLTTWLFAVSSRVGLGRLLLRPFWRKLAVWLFMNVHIGSDICGVAVRARGQAKEGAEEITLGVIGRNEAKMTAIIAAEMTRQILTMNHKAGVFHSEQIIEVDPVIAELNSEFADLIVSI
ncbi:Saccharopine dehydrogenase [Pseudovibrio axinellae]|uniref:Saccharopine dehydrogenase n=1 Tax=Pseudovibrio axinellae TaxID=989403 RepID=A0A165UJM4_9HYPH|nr:saccharopine dehydrogenase NADP-binding domain-containing protein [Pseudovibrio axinellae]KZL11592.1 Saccharopine dehydrogenase [Pseudovibrio axinellae]SER93337.1 Saccharopine dehydrogenase, NADP-dependent [Pseudovibrio axinellae]